MFAELKNKNKTLLAVLATLLIGVLLFAVAGAVGAAKKEKSSYISASERLALLDFTAAVNEMKYAVQIEDIASLNRAAGKAEAYLSRSGVGDCGEVYAVIGSICAGEYGAEYCAILSDAARKAIDGDGGAALRDVSDIKNEREIVVSETTDDPLSARILERIGRGRDDVAYNRAVSFACPNAVFDECGSDGDFIKYAGENIFIAIAGESARVQMYCFDRDIDPRYSVSEEDAMKTVTSLIKREKLKLPDTGATEFDEGIYRTVYTREGDSSDTALVTIEVYSDTGRLRKYDAVNYYHSDR